MTETYPYYRVTKWLKTEKACEGWFDWFVGLDVPVCVVKDLRDAKRDGELVEIDMYSVLVIGEESVGDFDRLNYGVDGRIEGNEERMSGDVIRTGNNWWFFCLNRDYNKSQGGAMELGK